MAEALERVVSVKQTCKAATCLPMELMQHVFSYLDCRSFYAARKVCRYWRFASTDAVPLARQLSKLPILPTIDSVASTPLELQRLFDEAARSLMIAVHSDRAWDTPGSLSRASKMGFHINSRTAATPCGSKTVTLCGRSISLFDTSGSEPVRLAQRTLNDLKETIGNGPWLNAHPNIYKEIALSSCGRLLAIAQERTIQIYDLFDEPDSFSVNEYISSAAGHYVCGIDFEQNDRVLRVRLSGRGTILYLGTPAEGSAEKEQEPAIDHWKSKRGLKHTFLDTSLLAISQPSNEADQAARISGLQLLQPFEDGYLFAGQRHGGGESSHYVLGHVKTSTPHNMEAPRAEPNSVTVLARLESYLSSCNFTTDDSNDDATRFWENMPSAHEHHPRFGITLDGGFIALAERDKKRIRPAPLTQLFVYRTPSEAQLRATLAQRDAECRGQCEGKTTKYRIPRFPMCLSTLQGDIESVRFSRLGATTYSISAATVETIWTWRLESW